MMTVCERVVLIWNFFYPFLWVFCYSSSNFLNFFHFWKIFRNCKDFFYHIYVCFFINILVLLHCFPNIFCWDVYHNSNQQINCLYHSIMFCKILLKMGNHHVFQQAKEKYFVAVEKFKTQLINFRCIAQWLCTFAQVSIAATATAHNSESAAYDAKRAGSGRGGPGTALVCSRAAGVTTLFTTTDASRSAFITAPVMTIRFFPSTLTAHSQQP